MLRRLLDGLSSAFDGRFVRPMTHGATDGLMATYTTIAASVGVNMTVAETVSLGAASAFGDGVTLAITDCMATLTALSNARQQRERVTVDVQLARAAAERRYREHREREQAQRDGDSGGGDDVAKPADWTWLAAVPDADLCKLLEVFEVTSAPPSQIDEYATPTMLYRRLLMQGGVTLLAFTLVGAVPILSLYLSDVLAGAHTVGGIRAGFVGCSVATMALLAVFGGINARHDGRPAWRGAVGWVACLVATTVIVVSIGRLLNWLVPTAVRNAYTCDWLHYFLSAPEY